LEGQGPSEEGGTVSNHQNRWWHTTMSDGAGLALNLRPWAAKACDFVF